MESNYSQTNEGQESLAEFEEENWVDKTGKHIPNIGGGGSTANTKNVESNNKPEMRHSYYSRVTNKK